MTLPDPASQHPSHPRIASFLRVVGAVLSGFIGIRKRHAADRDVVIKPLHLIVAGVVAALMFIATLVTIVRFIIPR